LSPPLAGKRVAAPRHFPEEDSIFGVICSSLTGKVEQCPPEAQDEALAWLRTQTALPDETVIEVAGIRHNVARLREDEWVLIRFPSLQELEED
jgi:hypothetical protein